MKNLCASVSLWLTSASEPTGGDQQLGVEYRGAGRAADGVVAERDEAVVEHVVGEDAADGDAHAAPGVAVEARLRAVGLVADDDGARGRRVQLQLLRQGGVGGERLAQLFR